LDSQHALNAKTGKWGDASPVKEIIAQISGLVKTLDYSSLTMILPNIQTMSLDILKLVEMAFIEK